MSETHQTLKPIPTELQRNWGWLLTLGCLFIVLGFIGLGITIWLTLASMIVLGILFIIAGFAQIVDSVKSHQWKGIVGHAVIAILYLIAGGLMIYDPVLASAVITALLAWLFIIIGITRFITAIALRHTRRWGWLLFAGVAAIVLGVLILMQWPVSALWVFGMLISVELIVNGWSYVFIALSMRRI